MTITHEGPVTLDEAKSILVARGYTVNENATGEDRESVYASSVERIGSSLYGSPACLVRYHKGTKNTAICI